MFETSHTNKQEDRYKSMPINDKFLAAIKQYNERREATLIAVAGPSGSGKTMSIDKLPRESTLYCNLEEKDQPFKIPFPFTTGLPRNAKGYLDLARLSNELLLAAEEPEIKYIVIDSFSGFSDQLRALAEDVEEGWEIWNFYSEKIWEWFKKIKSLTGKTVIVTARDEVVRVDQPDATQASRVRISVHGKDWEKRSIESQFTTVLWTHCKKNAKGEMEYRLRRVTDGVCAAKSPAWIKLPDVLPSNDLMIYINELVNGRQPQQEFKL